MLHFIVQQPAIPDRVIIILFVYIYYLLYNSHLIITKHTGITWRRDDGSPIILTNKNGTIQKSDSFEGDILNFMKVDRQHLGAYLCIAKNDVPPSVSKRILLHVNCKFLNYIPLCCFSLQTLSCELIIIFLLFSFPVYASHICVIIIFQQLHQMSQL
jgi:hypothetical protein